jgi:hypothetical protein
MLDFPNTPTVGDTFTAPNGTRWKWDSTKWSWVAAPPSGSGVTSFDGRFGDITLEASDITLAGGALLDSPQFINTPTAPTAPPGTGTDQLATTAFVSAAISAGGTFVDAPLDGTSYGRLNGAWTNVLPLTGGILTGALQGPEFNSTSTNGGTGSGLTTAGAVGFVLTGQPADANLTDFISGPNFFYLRFLNDAQSTFSTPMSFSRSGYQCTGVAFGEPMTIQAPGNWTPYNYAQDLVLTSQSTGNAQGSLTFASNSSNSSARNTNFSFVRYASTLYLAYIDSPTLTETDLMYWGTGSVTVPVNAGFGGTVTLSADPVVPLQAATKQYVDAHNPNPGGPFLPLSGGTVDGDVHIGTNTSTRALYLDGIASSHHTVHLTVAGINRWMFGLNGATAETGGNAGSDFMIKRYTDTGGQVDNPFSIARATGLVTISALNVGGSITAGGEILAPQLGVNSVLSGANWGAQGGYIGWNYGAPGVNGEMDFINSHGLGSGGFTWYDVASNSAATPVLLMLLHTNGELDVNSVVLGADPTQPLQAATKQYVDAHVTASAPIILFKSAVVAGGAMTGPQTISTFNIPAGTLANVGDRIHISTWCRLAVPGSSNGTVDLQWGASTNAIWSGEVTAPGGDSSFAGDIDIVKTAANTQLIASVELIAYPGTSSSAGYSRYITTHTENDTAAIPVKIVGSFAAGAGYTAQRLFQVIEYYPA